MSKAQDKIRFTKEPYIEDVGPRKIKSLKFSMLSHADITKFAEVQVWRGKYYDEKRKPIEGGLLDPRMGPANKSLSSPCATCHADFNDCPGHYGYMPLALPVYNIGYLGTILDILKCICKCCARILLEEELRKSFLKKMRSVSCDALKKGEIKKKIVQKCNALTSSKKAVRCRRCGYINGTVKKGIGFIGLIHDRSKITDGNVEECKSAMSHTKEAKASISPSDIINPLTVLSLFQRMLDEDAELLYLPDRPEKLIITNILVPPIAIRPSVFVDGGKRSNENDITERLKLIIQTNASLQKELLEPSIGAKCLDAWEFLQVELAQYINSEVRGVPPAKASSKPLSGFIQRLKGKQGRFRGNLSGKRVEYTGRTVISPDPNLKITEVAVPILMARVLTYPERVSHHNIEKLRQCVLNGPDKYPGARYIKYPDGTERVIMNSFRKRLADELKIGYVVDRHLEDGDVVLFNRQPSLHRMSIMCHRAKIMPWRTLRFNESVCNPYNADFDGDEMNMHVPQTEEARTEALLLMAVQNNLCTPKNGEILVASTQDFLTSSFLITRKDTFYDRATFSLMCSHMGDGMDFVDLPTPALIKPIELWTGKQLFNVLLRPNASTRVYVNLTVKEKSHCKNFETMCPNDGFVYFRNSELISGQLGKATLGNGNKVGLFSVLLRDYNAHAAATCMNRLAKLSARWIGNHGFSIGIDDVQPKEKLNKEKNAVVLSGYSQCDGFIKSFNEGKIMLRAGFDAAQILEADISRVLNKIREDTAKVCMQGLDWRNSPLIMSQCGSKGSPINISQMVACVGQQIVGGRRAPNGFIDRSLPHFPRKSKVPAAKGFVSNSFYSGLTATEFFFHTMGGREGLVDTAVKTADTGYMSRRLMKALEDLHIHYDNTVRNASGNIVQFIYGDDGMDPGQMEGGSGFALNFDRLFLKIKATCPVRSHSYMTPSEISDEISKRLEKHDMTFDGGCSDAFKTSLSNFLEDSILQRLKKTRDALGLGKNSVGETNLNYLDNIANEMSGITHQQLQVFLETCISRYHKKRVEAGTAIGAIGAQSIGEPGTQMTLKTFHFAGVGSMNVTLGVPRIKEIIDASKNISTPFIYADLECNNSLQYAKIVKGHIEKTVLGEVAKSIKIVLTPRLGSIIITLDMELIQASQFCIDAYTVTQSILQTPRIKLKQQHIRVLDVRKLEVVPQVDRSRLHFELHSLKNKLPMIVVRGINTVKRAVINEKDKKYNLVIEGTGLQAVMGVEGVIGCKTTSNHIVEVNMTLGIEAARKSIIDQVEFTMGGMNIDVRHMKLLADLMTSKGEVLGVTRNGIQRMKESVLMLASFEKTAEHLYNASVNGRDDKIEGVSECIIMGTPMQIGTGILKVLQSVKPSQQMKLTQGIDPIL